ncbi:hypothetical protein J6D24_02315 [Candidatus Saccharibacteria bacterium]|nr:hypothetical protein [Candidatus Saccharibacteria bacterium]
MSKVILWISLCVCALGIYNISTDAGYSTWKYNLRLCDNIIAVDISSGWRCVADANNTYDNGVETSYIEAIGGGIVAIVSGIVTYGKAKDD